MRAGWALGIDVGGTKIAAGVVRFPGGHVRDRREIPTHPDRGGPDVLERCVDLARSLHDAGVDLIGSEPVGVGIGVPELLDLDGNVTSSYSVPWHGVPVVESLSMLAPTRIEMDQNTAALAEAHFGAGVAHDPFLYVTVGTGLGCTLVQGGIPYRGARNAAGVFANGPMSAVCPHCGKEFRTVLDDIASGPALARRYAARTGAGVAGAEAVFDAAARGDADASEILRDGGRALGIALALLVDVLDPAVVVIGGGLGLAGGLYWEVMESAMREHIWSEPHRGLSIATAQLGADAGVVGAATAVWLLGPSSRQRATVDEDGGAGDERRFR